MKDSDKTTLAFATGAGSGTFKIADRRFNLRPMLIREVNEYLSDGVDKYAYVVARLNDRLVDKGDPIDLAWIENSLTYAEFGQITQLLISGSVSRPN